MYILYLLSIGKMHNLEQIRKTMWVRTGSNRIEEVNLDSYQSAENGENRPVRIVADGDETVTAGQIPARKSPTYAAVDPIKPTCSVPPTDCTVKYSSIDQQQMAKLVHVTPLVVMGRTFCLYKLPSQEVLVYFHSKLVVLSMLM